MMFTSSAQGNTPGVPGAHTASLAPEQADSISEILADGLGNGLTMPELDFRSMFKVVSNRYLVKHDG